MMRFDESEMSAADEYARPETYAITGSCAERIASLM